MIYLLYGTLVPLIDDYINSIIKKEKIDNFNIIKYDNINDINKITDDANTFSLFDSKKIIIVNINEIFTGKKVEDTTNLEKYIDNFNNNTILIFRVNEEKLDMRKKIYKLINKKGIIKEFNKISNLNSYVKKLFSNYSITNETINLLIKRTFTNSNNLNNLNNEIEKLKLYKIDNKVITNKDIIECTVEKININIFAFIDNIISKNKKEIIRIYKELIKNGEEAIKIIILLSNQFRLIYQAKILYNKGYTEDDIAQILHVKRYPVHLAIQKGYNYDNDVLIENISKLANLDIKIKSGEVDKNMALELYLLNI